MSGHLDDATRDLFFAQLYEHTTAPFQSADATDQDVKTFLAMAQPTDGARILDLGCGWGRHLVKLRERGFGVIGLERSRSLAEKAASNVPGAIIRGDIRELPLKSESFDAVACFYSSIFLFDEHENLQALKEVARVMKPGGTFFLETSNPIYLRRLGQQTQRLALPDGSLVFEHADFDITSGRENGVRKLTKKSGETIEGRFSVRYYAPGELEVMARRVGLKVERTCGDHDLGPFARGSRDLFVLFRKPA